MTRLVLHSRRIEAPSAGGLFHQQELGVSGCPACGWRGVTPYVDGRLSHECPACEIRETHEGDARGFYRKLIFAFYPWGLEALLALKSGAIYRPPLAPVIPLPKVGRNEPCPCQSGRKYKKCHGAAA